MTPRLVQPELTVPLTKKVRKIKIRGIRIDKTKLKGEKILLPSGVYLQYEGKLYEGDSTKNNYNRERSSTFIERKSTSD